MKQEAVRPSSDLEILTLTRTGTTHARNEDSFHVDAARGFFIIADGVGGQPAGDVASRLAVEEILRHLTAPATESVEGTLVNALLDAHQRIRTAANADRRLRGMGTTALIAWMIESTWYAWLAYVGNSRAYRFRNGTLTRLTDDHTLLQTVRQAGMLASDPEDWPPKTLLSQALGSSELIAPEVRRSAITWGDILLLCSDGISDVLEDDVIEQILKASSSLEDIRERLLSDIAQKGAPDDQTAILIHMPENDQVQPGDK